MLSVTFQPLTNFTDDLLSTISNFLRPVIIQFAPGQLGSVAALQLELAMVPLRIIAAAVSNCESLKVATTDWLNLEEPTPNNEPMPNIIDMAKARQQHNLPTASSPIPADAFTLFGGDGRFEVKESKAGHIVYRWVTLKKGLKVSQHIIPDGDQCDCRQAELGRICCHQKAVAHYLETQRIAETVAGWKEQERAQRLEAFRFQVLVWQETGSSPETFWEGANLEDAEFKLTVATQKTSVNTATIYDRRQDENLKFWHRFQAAQQVEDARQALGFSNAQPEDWKRRQNLEDSIVETASKLGWLPAQATAFQKSTLGLPVDSNLSRAEMTIEQLQQIADAFALALKDKRSEQRRQAALKSRAAS